MDIQPRYRVRISYHLTENGRVIGFLMEYAYNARHAGPQVVEICMDRATLIEFDTAQKCDDPDVLLQEMQNLTSSLEDISTRGGGLLQKVYMLEP